MKNFEIKNMSQRVASQYLSITKESRFFGVLKEYVPYTDLKRIVQRLDWMNKDIRAFSRMGSKEYTIHIESERFSGKIVGIEMDGKGRFFFKDLYLVTSNRKIKIDNLEDIVRVVSKAI